MDNLIDWFYGQLVGFLGNFFAQMGNMGVELFDLEWVQVVILFFSRLAWALFAVSLVVRAFECGIEYASGRANLQQTALDIIKGFFAVSLFTTVPVRAVCPVCIPPRDSLCGPDRRRHHHRRIGAADHHRPQ